MSPLISPVDQELLKLADLWEKYATGVKNLAEIAPAGERVDELLAWSASRQELIDSLDRKFQEISHLTGEISQRAGIGELNPETLEKLNLEISRRVHAAAANCRQHFSEMLLADARMAGKLKDISGTISNNIKSIKDGRRALQAYNPVDISEARFFDQKK